MNFLQSKDNMLLLFDGLPTTRKISSQLLQQVSRTYEYNDLLELKVPKPALFQLSQADCLNESQT
jgi:hypothetical protein